MLLHRCLPAMTWGCHHLKFPPCYPPCADFCFPRKELKKGDHSSSIPGRKSSQVWRMTRRMTTLEFVGISFFMTSVQFSPPMRSLLFQGGSLALCANNDLLQFSQLFNNKKLAKQPQIIMARGKTRRLCDNKFSNFLIIVCMSTA